MSTFVCLSSKSLEMVWNWVQDNPDDVLAQVYTNLCQNIGSYDLRSKEFDRVYKLDGILPAVSDKGKRQTLRKRHESRHIWAALVHSRYQVRDAVGRVIFNMIKERRKEQRRIFNSLKQKED